MMRARGPSEIGEPEAELTRFPLDEVVTDTIICSGVHHLGVEWSRQVLWPSGTRMPTVLEPIAVPPVVRTRQGRNGRNFSSIASAVENPPKTWSREAERSPYGSIRNTETCTAHLT